MTGRSAVVAALLVGMLAGLVRGQEAPKAPEPEHKSPSADARKAKREVSRNLELRIGGEKLGGVVVGLVEYEDGTSVRKSVTVIRLTRDMGGGRLDTFETRTEDSAEFGKDGGLVRLASAVTEAKVVTTSILDYSVPGKLSYSIKGPGSEVAKTVDVPADCRDENAVIRDAIAAWEKDNSHAGLTHRVFSLQRCDFTEQRVTVLGKEETEFGGVRHGGHSVKITSPDGDETRVVDADLLAMGGKLMGAADVVWVAHDPLVFEGQPIRLSSVVPVNVRIAAWKRLEAMTFTLSLSGDPHEGTLIEDNSYQKSTREGNTWTVTLGHHRITDANAKGEALPMAGLADEVKAFLGPTLLSQSDDPDIKAKAAEIVGTTTDSLAATKAVVAWVFSNLKNVSGARGNATAKEVLKDRRGDCTEYSALTVALLRAAGIPARNCNGMVYGVNKSQGYFAYHAWSEAWVGKWVPVDATVNEVGTGARFLLFGYNEPKMDDGSAKTSATLRRTSVVVSSYTLVGQQPVKVPPPPPPNPDAPKPPADERKD